MSSEDKVQLHVNRVSAILTVQVAPTVFVVKAETEELAEIIREIRRQAAPLHAGSKSVSV